MEFHALTHTPPQVRQKYIDRSWKAWVTYTQGRVRRKAWLYHRLLKRKCAIIEDW